MPAPSKLTRNRIYSFLMFERNHYSVLIGTGRYTFPIVIRINFLQNEIFSHEDDITDMKFHAKNADHLISGSTDGLICVFDISKTDEDDALLCTLNTESSVGNIDWHENALGKDLVSCITHTNDLQLYNMEDFDEAEMLVSFDRETVTSQMKVIYLIL